MGIVAWLTLGTVAGYFAGQMVRGDERLGALGHVLLGIVGALVGGFLADTLVATDPVASLDIRSMIVATIGAIIAVVVWDTMTELPARREPSLQSSAQATSQPTRRAPSRTSTRVGRRPV